MRPILIALGLVLATAAPSRAQWVVYDAATTYRNSVTAAVKEYLLRVQTQQHSELRRMAQRLSMFTNLGKYRLFDVPLWRIHDFEGPTFLFARDYHAALNYGDASGRAFLGVSHPVANADAGLGRLVGPARRALLSQLATLDLADSAIITATHDTGQVRYNGRRELAAIEGLQGDVTNGSLEQSATAVLDKISGAGLIGARQRQARIQLLDGVVEQLLMENKRARDTEAAAMNMQLVTWRDRAAANQAFVAGSGDALRTWRQP
ncbi:MAG: hypothetical protein AB7I23_02985 [Vicinamibacterales bacterium]